MIGCAPLAEAKAIPIGPEGARRNHPICRRLYATARHFHSSCCVSAFACLFNYPRHALASGDHEHRGTVSRSEAASREVRMLRRAMGPATTSNPKGNPREEIQPFPNRRDDLPRHRRAECRRMLRNHQRSDGQSQQAFHRHALVLSRSLSGSGMRGRRLIAQRPKQARCHHRRPCPTASLHTIAAVRGMGPPLFRRNA
jgi:hypothetical protein